MMSLDKLEQLFNENPDKTALGFEGKCHDCGSDATVDVYLTPEGFKIDGGAVYEPEPDKYLNKCHACYDKNPSLTDYQRCEVYSRVVGYLRPVGQWNEGKQAEFDDRRMFDPSSA